MIKTSMIKSQRPQISPVLNNLGNNFLRTCTVNQDEAWGGQLTKIANPKLGNPSTQPQDKALEWLTWKEGQESFDLGATKVEKTQRIIVEYKTEHLAQQWQQMVAWRAMGKEVWLHVDLAKTTSTEFNYLWQESNRLGVSLIVDNLATIMTMDNEGEPMEGKKRGHKQQNSEFKELLTTWAETPWVQQKLYPWELLVENFLLQQSLAMRGKETKISLNTENSKEFFPWKNKKIAKKTVQKMFEQWKEIYPLDKLTDMLTGNNDSEKTRDKFKNRTQFLD